MPRRQVARSEEIPERGAIRFRVRGGSGEVPAFAVRVGGTVRAYLNVCTHRELELDLGDGTFFTPDGSRLRCRAHGALFEPETGACAGGVCPKRSTLTELPVTEEDGIVWVEEGAPIEPWRP
ncbi:MAG TPA: Rieske (2Fe-2S) protein [Vulgatibacter sp.]|nr:Rieske (2Fe-2S) protein [Vulgatibacter sp.]